VVFLALVLVALERCWLVFLALVLVALEQR
jgi:hypothetical protein